MSDVKITREYVSFDEAVPKPNKNLVEVVRCKDCVRRGTTTCIVMEAGGGDGKDDWFCADGEKKEGS